MTDRAPRLGGRGKGGPALGGVARPGLMRVAVASLVVVSGCATRAPDARELYRASQQLGDAVAKGDEDLVLERVVVGERSRVELSGLMGDEAKAEAWADALREPTSVRPEGVLSLEPERAVDIVWTDDGWRFDSDPFDAYPQGTPREALVSFVLASQRERWDVMVDLAPRRYRIGLSAGEVQKAWTEGDYGAALRAARDRLIEHLDDPIVQDSHQAVMDLGEGEFVRLEREGRRWVVVDF